jgi:hypothetical protein
LTRVTRTWPARSLENEVPWEVSLDTQMESSALLLALGPGDRGRIPDRLLEALAVRRPVIAFGPAEAGLQELLRATGIGACHADSVALASALADLVRAGDAPAPDLNKDAIDPYRAEKVIQGVVELLSG